MMDSNSLTVHKEREHNQKVAVVTGRSSGIGFETSLLLGRNNFLTYASIQNLKKSDKIKALAGKERLPISVVHLTS